MILWMFPKIQKWSCSLFIESSLSLSETQSCLCTLHDDFLLGTFPKIWKVSCFLFILWNSIMFVYTPWSFFIEDVPKNIKSIMFPNNSPKLNHGCVFSMMLFYWGRPQKYKKYHIPFLFPETQSWLCALHDDFLLRTFPKI